MQDFERELIPFLRFVAERLPMAIWCKDYSTGTGQFVVWNAHAHALWGRTSEEILGQSEEILGQADHSLAPEGHYNAVENISHTNGQNAHVKIWKIPFRNSDGRMLFLITVAQVAHELPLTSEDPRHLIRQTAAELNSPMMGLLSRCKQLLNHHPSLPDETRHLLDSVSNHVHAATLSIERLVQAALLMVGQAPAPIAVEPKSNEVQK
jgi:PAS domain-containing protein